jgi:hypothetical protein
MEYNAPYGVSDPDAPYVNGNPTTGTMGSIPPAASIEYPQRELVNFITDAGLVPDNGDLHQLGRSVQTGHVIYGVDSGAANLLSIALTPPLVAYIDGMHIWVRVAVTNTGPAVISVNGLAGKNIVRRGGAGLQAGDLQGTYYALLVYNQPHSNFELYSGAYSAATGIPIMSANTNLYVNAATGDDVLYDGTSNAISGPHGPFKTIQRAMNETFKYGPSVYTMTINVAAGTYPEWVATPAFPGPATIIKGAGIGATFVTGANDQHTFMVLSANTLTVNDLMASTGTGMGPPAAFAAGSGSSLITDRCKTGFCASGAHSVQGPGQIQVWNHTYSGNMAFAAMASFGGVIFMGSARGPTGPVHAITNAVTVSYAWVSCTANGSLEVAGAPYLPTFSAPGFVSGYKYWASLNGVIETQGQGINYFPGTVAGSTVSGGQYH